MDSSAHTAAVDLEIIKENLVAAALEIITETASIPGVWIRQHTQPLLTLK